MPYIQSACGISDNLPKNLTTHLTHKLYSVFPLFSISLIIQHFCEKCNKNNIRHCKKSV
ncbi:hypothetical protein RUMCAL_00595 [Ruminococcus callidus ATCC 27760]|uniref:Uncharacterized protein n=1 Tax=Ruminococcus callidus ATCC 27760 TaxID=411473 RepID=U2M5M7_9FIRM|nr:hypothetical protein RUMCAL_00595 [Ruminococcus callidus ATCC 27760]